MPRAWDIDYIDDLFPWTGKTGDEVDVIGGGIYAAAAEVEHIARDYADDPACEAMMEAAAARHGCTIKWK